MESRSLQTEIAVYPARAGRVPRRLTAPFAPVLAMISGS
jgi:hypothetical protein